MSNVNWFSLFFSMFTVNLPTLIVCVVACVVIFSRWKQNPGGSLWALLGFGLALILCFAVPVVQAVAQSWVIQSGEIARRASLLTGLAILWSILRAATYVLLLLAVFAGRKTSDATTAPPLSQQ